MDAARQRIAYMRPEGRLSAICFERMVPAMNRYGFWLRLGITPEITDPLPQDLAEVLGGLVAALTSDPARPSPVETA
jgi:hypothetical protein